MNSKIYICFYMAAIIAISLSAPSYSSEPPIPTELEQAKSHMLETTNAILSEFLYSDALVFFHGNGVPQDHGEAFKLFSEAANLGHAKSQSMLGVMFIEGLHVQKNNTEAAKWFTKAANQGHANAQIVLGTMYTDGLGVPQDYDKALRWYFEAANQGDARGHLMLGFAFLGGKGAHRNLLIAKEMFQKACNGGLQQGCDTYRRLVVQGD